MSACADECPGVDAGLDESDRVELPAGVVGNIHPAASRHDPWDVRCAEPVQYGLTVQSRSGEQRDQSGGADNDVGAGTRPAPMILYTGLERLSDLDASP